MSVVYFVFDKHAKLYFGNYNIPLALCRHCLWIIIHILYLIAYEEYDPTGGISCTLMLWRYVVISYYIPLTFLDMMCMLTWPDRVFIRGVTPPATSLFCYAFEFPERKLEKHYCCKTIVEHARESDVWMFFFLYGLTM